MHGQFLKTLYLGVQPFGGQVLTMTGISIPKVLDDVYC